MPRLTREKFRTEVNNVWIYDKNDTITNNGEHIIHTRYPNMFLRYFCDIFNNKNQDKHYINGIEV